VVFFTAGGVRSCRRKTPGTRPDQACAREINIGAGVVRCGNKVLAKFRNRAWKGYSVPA
jgi:hypothetical protein